jgi:uncharacterized protein YbjT (DUF2867 family)
MDSSVQPEMNSRVLVTGATGYVGGRLVARLLELGYRVRASGRSRTKLAARTWANHPNLEIVACDVLDEHQMIDACAGCDVVYYLVHSMRKGVADFASTDRQAAMNMREAAQKAGASRIIYLGGLGEQKDDLSHHLQSRAEVGNILSSGSVPVTILRAGMIIGAGSASFEILRYLVQRLPIMITPRWVSTPSQPIAIRNVIAYLVGALTSTDTAGQTFDIGGPEVMTYREIMQIYADESGLGQRHIIPVPVFTPRLSSYWIHFVTPVPASIARPLAEGLRNPVVCEDNRIRDMIPQKLLSVRDAIRLSIERTEQQLIETHWTDAGAMPMESTIPGDPDWAGGTSYADRRTIDTDSKPAEIWERIIRLGGTSGWYHGDWLWRIRGHIDKILGGVGLSRGRRDAGAVRPGDALDFWRVLDVKEQSRLLLFAEMKLPGKAWLEIRMIPLPNGQCRVEQNALFVPSGLLGLAYWWAVTPLHSYVFKGMLRRVAHGDGAAEDRLATEMR